MHESHVSLAAHRRTILVDFIPIPVLSLHKSERSTRSHCNLLLRLFLEIDWSRCCAAHWLFMIAGRERF